MKKDARAVRVAIESGWRNFSMQKDVMEILCFGGLGLGLGLVLILVVTLSLY